MTSAVDASVVVAALVDTGPDGRWAEEVLTDGPLVGPHLLLVEAASILRRSVLAGQVPADTAALAHADLLELRIVLHDYEPYGERIWELHPTVTAHDAWYVAVAEAHDLPLATLDRRLARAPGPHCRFLTP